MEDGKPATEGRRLAGADRAGDGGEECQPALPGGEFSGVSRALAGVGVGKAPEIGRAAEIEVDENGVVIEFGDLVQIGHGSGREWTGPVKSRNCAMSEKAARGKLLPGVKLE